MSRQYNNFQALKSPDFEDAVLDMNEALGVSFETPPPACLIGGLAVAHYANPPVTVDVDFLVMGGAKDSENLRTTFQHYKWEVSRLHLPTRQRGYPRYGLLARRAHRQIDVLFTDHDRFLDSVVLNAVKVEAQPGIFVSVARPEDLYIIKVMAGREKDVSDYTEIERKLGDKLNWEYINEKLDNLL